MGKIIAVKMGKVFHKRLGIPGRLWEVAWILIGSIFKRVKGHK